jgi:hypothetical protein
MTGPDLEMEPPVGDKDESVGRLRIEGRRRALSYYTPMDNAPFTPSLSMRIGQAIIGPNLPPHNTSDTRTHLEMEAPVGDEDESVGRLRIEGGGRAPQHLPGRQRPRLRHLGRKRGISGTRGGGG